MMRVPCELVQFSETPAGVEPARVERVTARFSAEYRQANAATRQQLSALSVTVTGAFVTRWFRQLATARAGDLLRVRIEGRAETYEIKEVERSQIPGFLTLRVEQVRVDRG